MNKTVLCLALALMAAPALGKECTGTYTNDAPKMNDPVDLGNGKKITFFQGTGTVSSTDTPYNGKGGCAGYVLETDGGMVNSGTCVRYTEDGDMWGYTGFKRVGEKRGHWVVTQGTGKFAKNVGSSGWYEDADEQGSSGKWGGNCNL